MCDFLLRYDLLLRQNLHRVNPLRVALTDLKYPSERSATNQFQKFKIPRSKRPSSLQIGLKSRSTRDTFKSAPSPQTPTIHVELKLRTMDCSKVICTRISPLTTSFSKGRS